jgi:UDP-N-acetylmuramyl pentapeptide phosphotransferase/UDP-N-acetylglucosamine-1-phosphate transferase
MIWLLSLATFLGAVAATGGVLALLRHRAILDHPNDRSSHSVPTPRGGGLAVLPVLVVAWIAAGLDDRAALVLVLAVAVGAISWADDLWGLPVVARLIAQGLAVAVGMLALPPAHPVFQGLLPPLPDRLLAGIVWLWFVNLFNFMDGIDGISGVEAASIGTGLALALRLAGDGSPLALYALALATAVLGFLVWNWHPARIFLGDVGSVGLGYLLGWLLLAAACAGLWAPALLLPLYYLADATLTIGRRALRGEPVWQAHRQHFYQQAARRFASHATVSLWLVALNLALIALAAAAALKPGATGPIMFLAALLVGLLLWYFSDRPRRAPHAS